MTEFTYRILVADDEPNILLLICVMLSKAGYEIIKAENGGIAIEKAKQEKPDLIITDIMMPEKNGFEVCQAVRSIPEIANTPIIILSALGDEYNKISGFEGGADDYVTKPFNMEELRARVHVLLLRSKGRVSPVSLDETSFPQTIPSNMKKNANVIVEQVSSGSDRLDEALQGGFPKGGNILIMGEMGTGKSVFSRKFLLKGLLNNEPCMWIALDEHPALLRKTLSCDLCGDDVCGNMEDFEKKKKLCFVDAYSWSGGNAGQDERFAVTGVLELNQFSGILADASMDLGQTIQKKAGGRRVIDSISSLLVNFELPLIQRFLSQIARTAIAFGGVTTLFVLEEGTVSDQVLNNIKYLMDGVIELKNEDKKVKARILNMKWMTYSKDWFFW